MKELDAMLRQAQHEGYRTFLTLSLSKGEERRGMNRASRSGGSARVTNAASLSERPER
jgi:hypothetical protein